MRASLDQCADTDSVYVAEPRLHRWTRAEYYDMTDRGWFDGKRVELIDGEVIEMPAQRDEHACAVRLGDYVLKKVFRKGFTVCVQTPLDFGDVSQPEPDLAVVRGEPKRIRAHPTTALLVVEVSDTTLMYDRGRKARLYASRGIRDYWIVNLVDRQLEVRRQPVADGREPFGHGYASLTIFRPTDVVTPLARRRAKINVSDLLPK